MLAHQPKKTRTILHKAVASLLLFSVISTGTAAFAAEQQTPAAENYKAYVKDHYGIALSATVSKENFLAAVAKVTKADQAALAKEYEKLAKLTALDAVSIAVKAADLKELAYTYPEAKVTSALAKVKLTYSKSGSLSLQAAQELAVAIDTELLPSNLQASFKADGAVTDELASTLLGKIASFTGQYKNYLGTTDDADIYSKLYHAWTSSNLIDAPELRKVVDEGLKQNLVTGYNLKDSRFNANFDPKLSLTYGHSDITHAVQLIGLLKSEGLHAKVQLEPKTSAFIYLPEWGEPTQTPDYKVVKIDNGNYIAYSKEYDLSFEFATEAEKAAFDQIISTYAKKNEENAPGLIAASWWQPLYYSLTELKDYTVITNNIITKDHYIAQSFSLNDKSAAVIAGFKKLDPSISISSYQFWVDKPFHNYLLGDSK